MFAMKENFVLIDCLNNPISLILRGIACFFVENTHVRNHFLVSLTRNYKLRNVQITKTLLLCYLDINKIKDYTTRCWANCIMYKLQPVTKVWR